MDVFMILWIFIIGIFLGFLLGIVIIHRKVAVPLKMEKKKLEEKKRSMASIYGKTTEQFAPFMNSYPFDTQKFRFIGTPIDGIQFEEDKIVFVEIKSASSTLSPKQRSIKKLIDDKKVEWYTFKVAWE